MPERVEWVEQPDGTRQQVYGQVATLWLDIDGKRVGRWERQGGYWVVVDISDDSPLRGREKAPPKRG